VAGDAVVIALVSSQIPCKQGILQGILKILVKKTPTDMQETPQPR
jgi:hypothetical protein